MPMKLKLHHVNFCTTNVPGMTEFLRDAIFIYTGMHKG